MDLYFLRHASAGQSKPNPKLDEKRPLDGQGIEQAILIGRIVAPMDIQFDAIISSPLKRAFQTASLFAKEMGFEQAIELSDALRPHATYEEFQELLRSHFGKNAIVVVGHNPTESEFLSRLISNGKKAEAVELKKGAIAKVEVKQRKGTLQWLITPKVAKTIQAASATSSRPKTSRK